MTPAEWAMKYSAEKAGTVLEDYFARAIAEERERCAKVCDDEAEEAHREVAEYGVVSTCQDLARKIRELK